MKHSSFTRFMSAAWFCLLFVGTVAAQEKAAPKKPICLMMKVVQEVHFEEVKTRTEYKGWCKGLLKCRLEGKVIVGDGLMEVEVKMISNGLALYQIADTPLGKQVSKCDLERVRKEFPAFDPTAGFNPLRYKQTIEKLSKSAEVKSEFLGRDETLVYERKASAELPAGLIVGMPGNVRVGSMKIWVGKEDAVPRQVVAYDKAGKVVMKTTFDEIEFPDDIPDAKFEFKPCAGESVQDQTEAVLLMQKDAAGRKK